MLKKLFIGLLVLSVLSSGLLFFVLRKNTAPEVHMAETSAEGDAHDNGSEHSEAKTEGHEADTNEHAATGEGIHVAPDAEKELSAHGDASPDEKPHADMSHDEKSHEADGHGDPAAAGAQHHQITGSDLAVRHRVVERHGDASRAGVAPLVHDPVRLAARLPHGVHHRLDGPQV